MKLPDDVEALLVSAGAGSFLIDAAYALLALAAIGLIWRSSVGVTRAWGLVMAVAGFATPVLAYHGSLHPFPACPDNRGLIIAGIAAALVVVWFAYRPIIGG